jgi:hypothetical protein
VSIHKRRAACLFGQHLILREIGFTIKQRGFRTQCITVVTTLIDAREYPVDQIAVLYRCRWQTEINLRSLKSVMQMEHLRCKTPSSARKEFFMHLLAYNLNRKSMALAAIHSGKKPWSIGFKGALQTSLHYLPLLLGARDVVTCCLQYLTAIATHEGGDRPDRFEPRATKHREKKYDTFWKPRAEYRRSLAMAA